MKRAVSRMSYFNIRHAN